MTDSATEGVNWKARDLWSPSVERRNCSHGMQERKFVESVQSSAATDGMCPLAGGCCASLIRQHAIAVPHRGDIGCHGRIRASVLCGRAGLLRTLTPATPFKHTVVLYISRVTHPISSGRPDSVQARLSLEGPAVGLA